VSAQLSRQPARTATGKLCSSRSSIRRGRRGTPSRWIRPRETSRPARRFTPASRW